MLHDDRLHRVQTAVRRQRIVGNFGGHVIGKGALPDFAPWYEDGFTTGRGLKSSRKLRSRHISSGISESGGGLDLSCCLLLLVPKM
jgi:hypothetical protein